ncbi:unnamed protein product [Sphagnum balticum]
MELAGARRLPAKTLPCNYAATTALRLALLLLKFKTAEARSWSSGPVWATLAGMAWGLDHDLTPLQQQQHKALQPQFLKARKASKRPRWKGGELFVDGRSVRPST